MNSNQLGHQCTVATIRALVTENSVGSAIMSVCIPPGMEGADRNPVVGQLNIGDCVLNNQCMSHPNKPVLHHRRVH